MPNQSLALVTLVVADYDQAIKFYVEKLGFTLVEDTNLPSENKRWVVIAPKTTGAETSGAKILLARADTPQQRTAIGNQTGGRVFLFLQTDDFMRDYEAMRANGIIFREEPRHEPYGIVAVFEDLYGNTWDLLQPR